MLAEQIDSIHFVRRFFFRGCCARRHLNRQCRTTEAVGGGLQGFHYASINSGMQKVPSLIRETEKPKWVRYSMVSSKQNAPWMRVPCRRSESINSAGGHG
jgi:hypothetical protein